MKVEVKETLLKEIIGMDRGAMPKEFNRTLTINAYDCKRNPIAIELAPHDKLHVSPCEGQTLSWEGTIEWDGRHIKGVENDST